jgi:predicted dehydrogenase
MCNASFSVAGESEKFPYSPIDTQSINQLSIQPSPNKALHCSKFQALTMNILTNKVGDKSLNVVIVGCGMPKRGMGWYHLTQLMDMPNANVVAVVEPFFLNNSLCPSPPEQFTVLVKQLEAAGVTCTDCVSKLPQFTKDTMCLIAGRTPDNPKLFQKCVDHGATVIYLEKPGAPTVDELQSMHDLAARKGVKVYLGYNKNVTSYVQKALALAKTVDNSKVTFCHNNSYKREELEECFSRCSEGECIL